MNYKELMNLIEKMFAHGPIIIDCWGGSPKTITVDRTVVDITDYVPPRLERKV